MARPNTAPDRLRGHAELPAPEEPHEPTGDDATQLALELDELEPLTSSSPFAHPGFPWDDAA